jgi:ribosomal-protein-alanine N-acetyltransferase
MRTERTMLTRLGEVYKICRSRWRGKESVSKMVNSTEKSRMPQASRNSDRARPTHPTFETGRLRLRTLRPKDREFLAALDTDPDVMRYIHNGPLSEKAAMRWAETQIKMAPLRWHLHKWIVELREDQTKVGWVELSKFRGVVDPKEKRLSDDINLGYQFDKGFWGQGFASDAVRAVLGHAFDELDLDRVVAFPRKDNVRSTRLLEKMRFRRRPARRYRDESGHACQLFVLSAETWRS